MRGSYDFVIVGGGSAGSALANRLSVDPSTRVLVLEAGRPDYLWDVFIHMPAALTFPIGSRFYDWKYESEPEPHMNGRRIYHARGKVLGGSSSINAAKSASVSAGSYLIISPARLSSGFIACITPGLTVDICTLEFWVIIDAMMLPPKAGRVCFKMAV